MDGALLGDCRKRQNLPFFPFRHMTDEIVLMQTLHDYDDAPRLLIVETAEKGILIPVIDGCALGLGQGFIGF